MVHIVTDSTSDIPAEFVRDLNITVIPAHVIIDGQSYDDGVTLTREEFYQRLTTSDSLPTTATPSVGEFVEAYDQIGGDIISIHLSSRLSGVYSTAYAAAHLAEQARVTLFDSTSLAMGLGWQVVAAARAALQNQSVAAIMQMLADIRPRVRVYAALDTMEYLRRSGRVGWAKAVLGQLLSIKPIVEARDGEVSQLERVRTRHKMIERLKDLAYQLGPVDALAVQHTRSLADAQSLAAELTPNLSLREPIVVCEATTTIGTHIGPNGLGIIAVKANS
ncbi:MAG: DegV family protein [Anaerolineae bacterium]